MLIIYRVPAVLPEHVRQAFEERGVRLRPGDEVVVRSGHPPFVARQLDNGIIPHLSSLPVEWVEHEPHAPHPRRRASDRPAFPKLVQDDAEDRLA